MLTRLGATVQVLDTIVADAAAVVLRNVQPLNPALSAVQVSVVDWDMNTATLFGVVMNPPFTPV